jgi:DNA helicase IV
VKPEHRPLTDPVAPGPAAQADGPDQAPETRDTELEAEQRHIDSAYARLDVMRRAAERVAEGYTEVTRGGTHQARLEREAAEAYTRRRLANLDIGEAPLCFGRLDLLPPSTPASSDSADSANSAESEPYYIGRISVTDDDLTPLVVDWRAPVAEPFYRATAIEPMGVARRRHFQTQGRKLIGIDDEVFDADAAEASGFTVVGEGALLAALDRERTGRMRDIVATIQAEQDEAIRADIAGILVVAGGPGTGKTAVALHRAAYLLYTHRKRLASQGVLLVGPSPIFLRYIDEVLPSLGEDEVSLATPAALKPRLKVRGTESEAAAAVKGDVRMAKVIATAIGDRERPMPRDVGVSLDGYVLRLRRRDSSRIVERAHARRGTHNERRPYVASLVFDHFKREYRRALVRAYRADRARLDTEAEQLELTADRSAATVSDPTVAAGLARGEAAPAEWEEELATRVRRMPEVRAALDRMWPILSGTELVRDLFGFSALIGSAAGGVLSEEEQALLYRERGPDLAAVAWTDADHAHDDEADSSLGPPRAARPRSRRRGRRDSDLAQAQRTVDELGVGAFTNAADVLARYGSDTTPSTADDDGEPRTFGHILVDEAQDLSAMQWRMLARRCPTGSMTLVGDFGQASRPGALSSWDDVVSNLPVRVPPHRVMLTVNYRTPSEIMDVANRLLPAAAPGVEPARPVRSTGAFPEVLAVARDELVRSAAQAARDSSTRGGTVAVIAPVELHPELATALADRGAVADDVEAIDAPIAVLTGLDSKGLEFDHVIVVEPARLVAADRSGLRLLYVVLTRATRRLVVVHAEPLPEALDLAPHTVGA